jgi:hypothetical protein
VKETWPNAANRVSSSIMTVRRGAPHPVSQIPATECTREMLASPSIPSWNQIARFLESMRRLRDSSGFAA